MGDVEIEPMRRGGREVERLSTGSAGDGGLGPGDGAEAAYGEVFEEATRV